MESTLLPVLSSLFQHNVACVSCARDACYRIFAFAFIHLMGIIGREDLILFILICVHLRSRIVHSSIHRNGYPSVRRCAMRINSQESTNQCVALGRENFRLTVTFGVGFSTVYSPRTTLPFRINICTYNIGLLCCPCCVCTEKRKPCLAKTHCSHPPLRAANIWSAQGGWRGMRRHNFTW